MLKASGLKVRGGQAQVWLCLCLDPCLRREVTVRMVA